MTDLGDALKHVAQAAEYEEGLGPIRDQLFDAEAILSDAAREISSYMDSLNFDEEEFARIESRLDQIRNLQAKYCLLYTSRCV